MLKFSCENSTNIWSFFQVLAKLKGFLHNLKIVMTELKEWSREHFGHVSKQIEHLRVELEDLQLNNAERSVIKEKMYVLDELLYREEMLWLQQSRITWLKEGHRNTQYFHRKAVWRARKNLIRRLRKSDGTWCSVPSDMERMASSYFQELYTKDPTLSYETVLGCIDTKVTQQMNDLLDAPFSEKEVADALFQIGPIKAPGPDGFTTRD